ncbi:MAG TPA: tetratricopeptide repeat protein, partial [candidate division Zixibacteria bacterium]|nr:tetratricopeptide repeat protein [candidate division Zixibacteria bacterium]
MVQRRQSQDGLYSAVSPNRTGEERILLYSSRIEREDLRVMIRTNKYSRIFLWFVLSLVISMSFGGCWTSKEEKQLLEATPFYESSRAYLREGRFERAKEEILKALERYPSYVEAHIIYQRIRAEEIPPENLLGEYDRLMKQNQSDPRFHFLYGRLLGEIEKQEAVNKRAVELDEKNPWGYFGLGWVAFKRSDYEAAAEYFRRSI